MTRGSACCFGVLLLKEESRRVLRVFLFLSLVVFEMESGYVFAGRRVVVPGWDTAVILGTIVW